PAHEFMQAAHPVDKIIPGADMEVVGVAQLDLAVKVFQVIGGDTALDRGRSADIHKSRHFDFAVNGGKGSAAGAALHGDQFVHGSGPFSVDKHCVAKAEKPVFFLHSDPVSIHN